MGRSTPPICSAASDSLKTVPIPETEHAFTINWRSVLVWLAPLGRSGALDLIASMPIRVASWRRLNAQPPTPGVDAPYAHHIANGVNLHENIPEQLQPFDVGEAHMGPIPHIAPGRPGVPSPLLGSLMGMR